MVTVFERLSGWITRRFSLVFAIALVVGLAWQGLAGRVQPAIAGILMGVIYLSFLRVHLGGLGDELRDWRRVLMQVVFLQLALPAAGFYLLRGLCLLLGWEPGWAAAGLLILLAPAGAIVPTLCLLLHGRFERGVLLLVITSLSVPLTMPLMLMLLHGSAGSLSPMAMVRFLGMVMTVPALLALLTRRFLPAVTGHLHNRGPVLSVLALSVVIVGAVAGLRPVLMDTPMLALEGVVISSLTMIGAFAAGWWLGGGTPRERMTLAIAATWTNIGLAIVTANQVFADSTPSLILLGVTLGEIPWNALFPPAQWFAARHRDKAAKAAGGQD